MVAEPRRAWPSLLAALVVSCALVVPAAAQAKSHSVRATFSAHGSAEQVYATGAGPRALIGLVDGHGHTIASARADSLGGILFRRVRPGRGYRLRQITHRGVERSAAVTVFGDRSAPPSTGFYRQPIPTSGYGYLATRDGTKLAIDVRLPAGKGPYPTLVEYSGYGYADPAGPQNGIAQIANLLGFAVVDVNIRGTGCSGGAYDYFEALQNLDGYDVIETVAHQPWVLHHKVGLMGISFGAISQPFVAQTDPPDLAAIAPMSTIDNSGTLLRVGGILNTGFTLGWVKDRVHDALPASPTGGQAWAFQRIQHGDATCRADQILHGEAANLLKEIKDNPFWVPAVAAPIAPITFVNKIRAPVYLACQFTDEQTGGHCPALANHFTGTRLKWFTFENGVHADSLDPATLMRWFDFLELFVARRAPHMSAATIALAPTLYQAALGVPGVHFPADPIQAQPTYAAALAAFERLPSVRILFDNGAGGASPGQPVPGFEHSFSRFPIPGTRARSWYLGSGGALSATKASTAGSDVFRWDKGAVPANDFSGDTGSGPGGLWTATPHYTWAQNKPGTALSYLTAALTQNAVVIGAGAVQLWLKSSAPDVDLQVTVSEVRPDGSETFVQNGWLRASERKLDRAQSTLLAPVPTLMRADAAPLPKGRFTELTVPLYYEGHAYRKGSRIRITIAAPGGAQPIWAFEQTTPSRPAVTVAHAPTMPSRLVLPVVPGVTVPSGLPPCPGLRGEPCRSYRPLANRSAGA